MGLQHLTEYKFSWSWVVDHGQGKTPIILVLTDDCDPTIGLKEFCKENFVQEPNILNVVFLSDIGEYMNRIPAIIRKAAMDGQWLVLHNCHLAGRWLSTLQDVVDTVSFEI